MVCSPVRAKGTVEGDSTEALTWLHYHHTVILFLKMFRVCQMRTVEKEQSGVLIQL